MSRARKPLALLLVLVLLLPSSLIAQSAPAKAATTQPAKFDLTIDNIMRGPGLVGYEPREARFSGDGKRIYFAWKQRTDPILGDFETYVVNADGSGLKKLTEEETRLAPPNVASENKARTQAIYTRDGDLYLYDFTTDKARRLTRTGDIDNNPRFHQDGKRVTFTRASNLYALNLEDGSLEKLTEIRPAAAGGGAGAARPADGEERKGTDSQEWLKKEEKELLDIIKQRTERTKQQEDRRKRNNPRKPFSLTARQTTGQMQLSPDGKWVVANINESAADSIRTVVPNYINPSGYTDTIPARTKVGDTQDKSRLAVFNVATGEQRWVSYGIRENVEAAGKTETQTEKPKVETPPPATQQQQNSANPQQRQQVGAEREPVNPQRTESTTTTAAAARPKDRDVASGLPVWSDDGTKAVFYVRAADNKDAWIVGWDPVNNSANILANIHDNAWVNGFGPGRVGWLKDNEHVYYISEKTGYLHLYVAPFKGGESRALTSGNWEVLNVEISADKEHFLLRTNEGDPNEQHIYRMSVNGGPREKLTTAPGNHDAIFSRDYKTFADIYSAWNKPPELFVQSSQAGGEAKKITDSPAPEFWQHKWLEPQLVHIPARDGAKVPGHFFKPANWKRGGPAVIFVHGAGYLQNVHRGWSNYYREYMFHNFLVSKGYAVLQIDYRGSAGYGRDWRTGIYRHMGGKDLTDHVDSAKWLVEQQGAGAKRIGIYGGSYGGFITIMGMFTTPDVFAAGAALRPVTDWAHYNHPYTSNILNTPQSDAEAYKKSSPIYFAEGLKGALLLMHGVVDVNVHYQDTMRLAQRLIELRKKNWWIAPYPVEDHSFVQPTSWADEYERIYMLFEQFLK